MKKAVIATTVLATYNTPAEAVRTECVLKTIDAATKLDYPIVVIDGGSTTDYVDTMRRLGATVKRQTEPGMGNARRQALYEAREVAGRGHAIVWTEPEKYPLVPLLESAVTQVTELGHDLVMLRRTSLDSYPPEQAMAYKLIALAMRYLTGIDCDFGWGPTVLSTAAVDYYLKYVSDYGDMWDGIHCPKLHIIKAALPWTVLDVDYHHPPEQTDAETGMGLFMKRIEQVRQLVTAIESEVDKLDMRQR
jgi:glycosyltransferase involved in cell wall biosynthesis